MLCLKSISYDNDPWYEFCLFVIILYMAIATALHLQRRGMNKYAGSSKEFIFIIVIFDQINKTYFENEVVQEI
jgi:uncharacterized membrane protein SirB2